MNAKKPKLRPREKRFVEEYVVDFNAVQAYFRAFGRTLKNGKMRSYTGSAEQARRLLKKPEVKEELKAARAEIASRTRVNADRIIREIMHLAMSDPADLYEPDPITGLPRPRPWSEVPPSARRAVQSIKTKRRVIPGTDGFIEEVEYKLHPKSTELDKLCRNLGFYLDQQQQQQNDKAVVEVPVKDPLPEEPILLEPEPDAPSGPPQ